MSTPLFIREITGSLVSPSSATPNTPVNFTLGTGEAADESALIESLIYCADDRSTNLGELTVWMTPPGGSAYRVGAYEVAAGTADLRASGEIEVNLSVPVGWKVGIAHDVGTAPKILNVAFKGGIIR